MKHPILKNPTFEGEDGNKYRFCMERTFELMQLLEMLLISCERKQQAERDGTWAPHNEDMFSNFISEARKVYGDGTILE